MFEFLINGMVADAVLDLCYDLIDATHYEIVVLCSFPQGKVDGRVIEIVIDEFSRPINLLDSCVYIFVNFLVESNGVLVEHVS